MSRSSGTAGRAGPLIRRAIGDDAGRLSDLALRSKAVWGYDAAFMDACRVELTISAESIRQRLTFLFEDRGRLAGFYQLRLSGPSAEVAQFFIAPEEIRSGLGRRLWPHLERTARNAGANWLEVDSDPNAEGFYLAMGMERHGEAPSGSIAGRLLPHLVKEVAAALPKRATVAGGDL
ncbi:MAG TPA: GNAT family N-acetyltransferase [Geminicoccaceae bacterium]|nr:GNAT family N-acetyltransferase [Geminicoccaceae bacterium]